MMKNRQTLGLKRVIVDYKKLNRHVLDLLVEKYPDGYDDRDIVTYRNSDNEIVECIEVRTENTAYLVKVSKRLVMAMEDHEESDNDNDEETSLDTDGLETSEEE